MLPPIIALCGPARSGKSTLSRDLVIVAPGLWHRMRFAHPIRHMLRGLLAEAGYNHHEIDWHLEDPEGKEEPLMRLPGRPTTRILMRTLGQDWGREMVHADLWVCLTMAAIHQHLADGEHVVIDDVRMDNEARAIAAAGGLVVAVDREGFHASEVHASEQGVSRDLIHHRIANDASPRTVVLRLLDRLGGR